MFIYIFIISTDYNFIQYTYKGCDIRDDCTEFFELKTLEWWIS